MENLFKCPLVNETLWPEIETFGFQSETFPTLCQDQYIWKIRLETVSRPRCRDRDYNSATC